MRSAAAARQSAMAAFLAAAGWRGIVPTPLAGDASFRRYDRLRRGCRSAVLMDAPPPHEEVGPFVAVAAILRDLGLSAPRVLAEDRAEGFLLIEDFGDDTYTRLLRAGADEPALYAWRSMRWSRCSGRSKRPSPRTCRPTTWSGCSAKQPCWSIGTCRQCSARRPAQHFARSIWRCGGRP